MERDRFYTTICVDIDGVLVDTRGCREGCDYSGYPERFSQLRRSSPKDEKHHIPGVRRLE